jgi:hypothetical protein
MLSRKPISPELGATRPARHGDRTVKTVWNYRPGFGRCGIGDRTGTTKKTNTPNGFRVAASYFVVAEE